MTITILHQRYFLCKFLIFCEVYLDGGFQSFLNMPNRFQSWHKVANVASIDATLMSSLQNLDTFLSTLGSSIKYVRKIFRKTNISNSLIRTIRGLGMLVFQKILLTYLMNRPFIYLKSQKVARKSSIKKVFLKLPQNSPENICAGAFFAIKLQAGGLQLH